MSYDPLYLAPPGTTNNNEWLPFLQRKLNHSSLFSLPKEKSVAAFSSTDFSPSLTEKLMGLRRHLAARSGFQKRTRREGRKLKQDPSRKEREREVSRSVSLVLQRRSQSCQFGTSTECPNVLILCVIFFLWTLFGKGNIRSNNYIS